jgi:hypothetical protein
MMEVDFALTRPECPKRMDIAVADSRPIPEFYPEFERGPSRGHEIGLVDSELFVEAPDVRQGRFTDSDDADCFRFYQTHVGTSRKQFDERGGRHPPRGATANNDYLQP